MSRIVDHLNHVAPEIADLTVDQPANHRWLPTPVTPVLATPAALAVALVAAALMNTGGGCLTSESESLRPPVCN